MGFAFVLVAAPVPVAEAAFAPPLAAVPTGARFSLLLSPPTFAAPESGPLRLLPSSKNLLLPSPPRLGLAAALGVVDVLLENVRFAVLGLRTLIPDSLRWYVVSRLLPAFAQSRLLCEAFVVGAVTPSRRQLLQIAGVLPERSGVVDEAVSPDCSCASGRVLSSVSEGREAFDCRLAGRTSVSDAVDPAFEESTAPASAATTPGGRYLLGGGLAAADDSDAAELP